MKELILNNGGRPVYTDDIKIIQDNIALIEHFLSLDTKINKQGCVLCGCQLEYSTKTQDGTNYDIATITEGYVFLDGKVRHVDEAVFAWKTSEATKYPFYIVCSDSTSEEIISYNNGRTANLYNEYSAKAICEAEKSEYTQGSILSLKYSTTDSAQANRFPNFYDLWDGTTDSALIHDFKTVIELAKEATAEAENVVDRASAVEKEAEKAVADAKTAITKANTAASECSEVAQKIDGAVADCVEKTAATVVATEQANKATSDCFEEIELAEEVIKQANNATLSANTATANAVSATSEANNAAARADKATQASINQTEAIQKTTEEANKTIASVNDTVSKANSALTTANKAISDTEAATVKTNTAISNAEKAILSLQNTEASVSTAEKARVDNEEARIIAENQRASQESSRVDAETVRVLEFETAKTNSETQTNICESYNNHPPKVGANNNWWFWNPSTEAYYDSGSAAKGGVVYPVFTHEGNKLYLSQDLNEPQKSFAKQGNKLTFSIVS